MTNRTHEFLLRQILEQQNPKVQFRVGMNLLTGKDVPAPNPLVGRLLLTMAASNGHRRSMWVLQIGYINGKWEFPVDEEKGMYWGRRHVADLHHGADTGDKDAIETLEILNKFQKYQQNKKKSTHHVNSEDPPTYKSGKNVFHVSFKKPMQLDGEAVSYHDLKNTLDNVAKFKPFDNSETDDETE